MNGVGVLEEGTYYYQPGPTTRSPILDVRDEEVVEVNVEATVAHFQSPL
jgi:hypothetical protein